MDVEVISNREEVIKKTKEAIIRGLVASGIQCEGYAKMLCPVDTGNLRNSITNDVVEEEQAVYIGTNVEYAPYVEFGTSRTKAQPFLTPAAEDHAEEYGQIISSFLKEL